MLRALPGMISAAQRLTVPTMQIGDEDESFHPDSWDRLFSAIAVDDKVFNKYAGAGTRSNEINKKLPLADLKDWINRHQQSGLHSNVSPNRRSGNQAEKRLCVTKSEKSVLQVGRERLFNLRARFDLIRVHIVIDSERHRIIALESCDVFRR